MITTINLSVDSGDTKCFKKYYKLTKRRSSRKPVYKLTPTDSPWKPPWGDHEVVKTPRPHYAWWWRKILAGA